MEVSLGRRLSPPALRLWATLRTAASPCPLEAASHASSCTGVWYERKPGEPADARSPLPFPAWANSLVQPGEKRPLKGSVPRQCNWRLHHFLYGKNLPL